MCPKQPMSENEVHLVAQSIILRRAIESIVEAGEQALAALPNVTPTQAMARRKLSSAMAKAWSECMPARPPRPVSER